MAAVSLQDTEQVLLERTNCSMFTAMEVAENCFPGKASPDLEASPRFQERNLKQTRFSARACPEKVAQTKVGTGVSYKSIHRSVE